jgi:CRISPR type I-E-associated protein CasA/Cse1
MDDPFHPIRETPFGYLDYLTWQNRKFLIIPEDDNKETVVRQVFIARGLNLSQESLYDPFKQYTRRDNVGWKHWVFTENRDLWRDSNTLFQLNDTEKNRPPQNFQWLSELLNENFLDSRRIYRCIALGMATHYKDAKIYFYRQESLPLPLIYLEEAREELISILSNALANAGKARGKLWGSVNELAKSLISPTHDFANAKQPDPSDIEKLVHHWDVERFYWAQLELPFSHLLQDLPHNPRAVEAWNEAVISSAWEALERAISFAGDSAAALKAAVRARGRLGYSLNELFPRETDVN